MLSFTCIFLQCNNPAYSGNGTICARDSDEDTLPDVDLGCDEIYCEEVCYTEATSVELNDITVTMYHHRICAH